MKFTEITMKSFKKSLFAELTILVEAILFNSCSTSAVVAIRDCKRNSALNKHRE